MCERRRATTFVAVLFLAVNGVRPLHSQTTTRRDSAGIAITDNSITARLPRVQLGGIPIAKIGGIRSRPEEELVATAPKIFVKKLNGNYLVADGDRLILFRPNGSVAQTIGRSGAGPGEFREINGLCLLAGDTILVMDYRQRRTSLFSPTGKHLATIQLPGFAMGERCLADGRILIREWDIPGATIKSPSALHQLYHPAKDTKQAFGTIPLEVSGLFFRHVSVVGHKNSLFLADGERISYTVRSPAGRLVQIVRVVGQPRTITPARLEQQLNSAVPKTQPMAAQKKLREFFLGLPVLKEWPMVSALHVDTEGTVWLQETDATGTPSTWLGFSASGQLIARLQAPKIPGATQLDIVGFAPGEAHVRYFDGDDSPTIAVYRITLPGLKR